MSPEQIKSLVSKLSEYGATWGIRVVGVLVALFIGYIIAGAIGRAVTKGLQGRDFDATLSRFFGNVIRYLVLIGVVLGCLGVFGIETSSFAALIASAGLAVGLAFQGTLGNFAAGIMLLVFRPFKVGDLVKVNDVVGVVDQIELFTTTFDTPDNRRIIVPNSKIASEVIENLTFHPKRRVDVVVGVDYTAKIDDVRKILEKAAATVPGVLKGEKADVFLKELGDSAVVWEVRTWCDPADYWAVFQATMRATKGALDEAGVGIPFPQMDLHVDKLN